jgi:hypothetical protein
MSKFKWSPSALNLLATCGEAFRRRYVEGERFPSSPRQLRGRAVHHVAQTAYTRVLHAEALPTAEEAHDLAATRFESDWSEGVQLEPDEQVAGEQFTKGESLDFAVDLAGFHVTRVAPTVQPVAVEEAMTAQLPESDVLVHGIIDLIALTPSGEVIRDVKTSEKSPNVNAADNSLQLTVYSALYQAEMGHLPLSLQLDYLTRSPVRKTKGFIPLVTRRDNEDLKVLGARVQAAVSVADAGRYLPAAPDSWACSAKFCSFHSTCKYVRRGARPTS